MTYWFLVMCPQGVEPVPCLAAELIQCWQFSCDRWRRRTQQPADFRQAHQDWYRMGKSEGKDTDGQSSKETTDGGRAEAFGWHVWQEAELHC